MTCASCVQKVEKALVGVDDVEAAVVNLANRTAIVKTTAPDDVGRLIGAVGRVGYGARPHSGTRSADDERRSLCAAADPGDRLHGAGARAQLRVPRRRLEHAARVAPDDSGRVRRRMALLPFGDPCGSARHDDDGHAGGPGCDRRVPLQRVRDGDRRDGSLLRHRRRDRHADPGREDPRSSRAGERRRRIASAARAVGEGGHAARRRGGAPRADRGGSTREPGGRPTRGEDPCRRGRRRRGFLGRPLDADRRVRPDRRRPGERSRRCLGERTGTARRVRHEGRRQHEARRDRPHAPGRTGVQGAGPASRRPRIGRVRPRRDADRRSDLRWAGTWRTQTSPDRHCCTPSRSC